MTDKETNMKRNLYDLIALFTGVKNINWDEEYPPDYAEDYFWDSEPALKLSPEGTTISFCERDAG